MLRRPGSGTGGSPRRCSARAGSRGRQQPVRHPRGRCRAPPWPSHRGSGSAREVVAEPVLLGKRAKGIGHRLRLVRVAAIGAMRRGQIQGVHDAAQMPELASPGDRAPFLRQGSGRLAALPERFARLPWAHALASWFPYSMACCGCRSVVDPQAGADMGRAALEIPLQQAAGPVAGHGAPAPAGRDRDATGHRCRAPRHDHGGCGSCATPATSPTGSQNAPSLGVPARATPPRSRTASAPRPSRTPPGCRRRGPAVP